MSDECNLLVRVAAACRLLVDDLAKLPDEVATEQFVDELRRVCGRAARRLEELAGNPGAGSDEPLAETG
jgi:hypothetical protein